MVVSFFGAPRCFLAGIASSSSVSSAELSILRFLEVFAAAEVALPFGAALVIDAEVDASAFVFEGFDAAEKIQSAWESNGAQGIPSYLS